MSGIHTLTNMCMTTNVQEDTGEEDKTKLKNTALQSTFTTCLLNIFLKESIK